MMPHRPWCLRKSNAPQQCVPWTAGTALRACGTYGRHFAQRGSEFSLRSSIVHAPPRRQYRLLHLSSSRRTVLRSSRSDRKKKSADRDFALRADFLLFEMIILFIRERCATLVSLGVVPGLKDRSLVDQTNC